MYHYILYINRPLEHGTSIIVDFYSDEVGLSVKDIRRKVTRAVTNWIEKTEEGAELYEDTTKDLNIADIANVLDSTLKPYLEMEGLKPGVLANTQHMEDNHEWGYDTQLYHTPHCCNS